MRNTMALMGILTVATAAAGPAMATDTNPWRTGQQVPLVQQAPQPNPPQQAQPFYNGYSFAPLADQGQTALPRTVVGSQLGGPVGGPVPAYGAGYPAAGYGQPYGLGGGYPATGYPGGYPGLGYPGIGYPGVGYPGLGYPGNGWGGPYGGGPWTGGGSNGLTGPLSWLPFW